eukprot:SAG31_NODE_164_length_21790_cov_26.291411_8_plen_609_part_00
MRYRREAAAPIRNSQLIERGSIVERAAAPLASMPDGDETALSPLLHACSTVISCRPADPISAFADVLQGDSLAASRDSLLNDPLTAKDHFRYADEHIAGQLLAACLSASSDDADHEPLRFRIAGLLRHPRPQIHEARRLLHEMPEHKAFFTEYSTVRDHSKRMQAVDKEHQTALMERQTTREWQQSRLADLRMNGLLAKYREANNMPPPRHLQHSNLINLADEADLARQEAEAKASAEAAATAAAVEAERAAKAAKELAAARARAKAEAETRLRSELNGIAKLSELRKKARAAGLSEEHIDLAGDHNEPRTALVDLIVDMTHASATFEMQTPMQKPSKALDEHKTLSAVEHANNIASLSLPAAATAAAITNCDISATVSTLSQEQNGQDLDAISVAACAHTSAGVRSGEGPDEHHGQSAAQCAAERTESPLRDAESPAGEADSAGVIGDAVEIVRETTQNKHSQREVGSAPQTDVVQQNGPSLSASLDGNVLSVPVSEPEATTCSITEKTQAVQAKLSALHLNPCATADVINGKKPQSTASSLHAQDDAARLVNVTARRANPKSGRLVVLRNAVSCTSSPFPSPYLVLEVQDHLFFCRRPPMRRKGRL